MPSLFISTQVIRICPRGYSSAWICRPHCLRQLQRHASSARPAARRSAPVIPKKPTAGNFRPELLRFLTKMEPTVLVESRSPTAYKIGTYLLAGFCITYSAINYFYVLHDPPRPLSSFVRGTHSSIDIAMAAFGVLTFFKTFRIISRITAVPYTVNSSTGQKGLMLRIETYRTIPLPGRGKKVTEIPADTVTTSARLGITGLHESTPAPLTRDEKIAERMWMKEQRRKEHKDNMARLYTMPFRDAGYWLGRGFTGLRDMIAGDGFVHLKARDRNGTWKISRDFDWALDAGHAFDKVVKVDVW